MNKRAKIIITSFILSLGFIIVQLLEDQYRFESIVILSVVTVISFYWALKEGIGKNMSLLVFILPFLFTLGVGFFWFLLPVSIFTRIPIVIVYGAGIYILSLTANIYTVGTIKTIALLRAARGVGFVLTLFTSFLIYDAILSARFNIYVASALIAVSSLLLYFQGLWTIPLTKEYSAKLLFMASIFSLTTTQISAILFFWPTTVVVGSLFLTIAMYIHLGLGQAKLETRLFSQTVREYLVVGILVSVGMFFATHWGA